MSRRQRFLGSMIVLLVGCSSKSGGDGQDGGVGFGGSSGSSATGGTGAAAGEGGASGSGGTSAGGSAGVGAAGAAGAAPCSPPSETFYVGDTAQACDYSLTVVSVTQCEPAYSYSTPPAGHIWLGVNLVVAATDGTVWSNPSHAKVLDGGYEYAYAFATTTNCNPGLGSKQLQKGEQTAGWVVYEVPDTAAGLFLKYDPPFPGGAQPVTFDLGW